ncbi:MAG TPA: glycoside hydrolase family 2 TIM barrel-domain containing protein [Verrucomicrobiae bacterium]|nr:glycoside hydrolase family 2 TIM barrel-domain containing protein [Verrucomicrobiae bacterium]
MKSMNFVCRILVTLFLATSTINLLATDAESPREKLLLDFNWKFHLGDDWPNALRLDKAGASGGPASPKFNDDGWRTLNLPHDWVIELPFDKNADTSHGFKPVGPGYSHNSIGWYRRTFDLPAADSGKRIWLDFDGVFRDATVWVNGWLVTHHEGGYYPFRGDITDIVKFGGPNTIAVKVDASKFEGWFYEGAGIYRHVWLEKTSPVAIAPDGIYVSTRFKINNEASKILRSPVTDGPAQINVVVDLLNNATNLSWQFPHTVSKEGKPSWEIDANVKYEIVTPNGETHAVKNKTPGMNSVRLITDKGVAVAEFDIDSPELWSPESPKLYKLITTVSVADKIVDRQETEFGIRTVAFDKDKGFLLNGQPYELKGTCNHQDMAGVGAALPDALQYFRVKKLKEFGDNAYRTSHNPPTPELLEACDRLGMIVMDESRLLGSDAQNMERWQTQILRDRNHPSVCIWSIANEEFSVQDTPQAANVARAMQDFVKRLDPTRPVTYASPEGDVFEGVNSVIEVRGWNYHVGGKMDQYHAEHPNQPEVGTEQASTVSTRGIYANDKARGYVSAYDVNVTSWSQTAEQWWSYFAARPWLSGGFVWTGFDYRGEPTPYSWPCINSHFGVLDTCGFPKDNFYYYQSWWTTNVVLHLLPHWNWPGKEGQEIRVDALSNCKAVELFLNGASLGKRMMQKDSKLTWQVKYAPGTLSAKGFDDAGNVIAQTKVETTGEPTQVQLTPDRKTINADGEDVSVFTVAALDAQGRVVPVAANKINFNLSGAGKILGVGNGDPSCHEPDTFVMESPVKVIPFNDWRWHLTDDVKNPNLAAFKADFADSGWDTASSEGEASQLAQNLAGIFRQHIHLSAEDLASSAIEIQFGRIDDLGWIYVNGQRVGESRDWSASPAFEIKKFLREGDNVVAVGVQNVASGGGIGLGVYLQIAGQPIELKWSRSLFNGLAEIIVQSTKDAGEIQLTAGADGLKPATATIQTAAVAPRPFVP